MILPSRFYKIWGQSFQYLQQLAKLFTVTRSTIVLSFSPSVIGRKSIFFFILSYNWPPKTKRVVRQDFLYPLSACVRPRFSHSLNSPDGILIESHPVYDLVAVVVSIWPREEVTLPNGFTRQHAFEAVPAHLSGFLSIINIWRKVRGSNPQYAYSTHTCFPSKLLHQFGQLSFLYLARDEGFEPPYAVLETAVLPLN